MKLKQIRKNKGITQEQLSALSKVSIPEIRCLEQGKINDYDVKLGTYVKLAKALNVKISDLTDIDLHKKYW